MTHCEPTSVPVIDSRLGMLATKFVWRPDRFSARVMFLSDKVHYYNLRHTTCINRHQRTCLPTIRPSLRPSCGQPEALLSLGSQKSKGSTDSFRAGFTKSTLSFNPKGCEFPSVLIHLLPIIFGDRSRGCIIKLIYRLDSLVRKCMSFILYMPALWSVNKRLLMTIDHQKLVSIYILT